MNKINTFIFIEHFFHVKNQFQSQTYCENPLDRMLNTGLDKQNNSA